MLNKLHLQQTSIRPPVADRSFAAKNRKQYPRLPLVQNTNKTFHAIASNFLNLSDLKASKHFEKNSLEQHFSENEQRQSSLQRTLYSVDSPESF